ncbi:hypothetical protein MML48_3g00007497 [Holotrichia oblita]|uniref:Uncharacterized protein n=1 Tax=Holotrichia oblita TaxID=644536 RepID=A0ACB9TE06_HOLOL|nr:hypothetical protein MML48_3g00007497 [Holotrichia oblita]
MTADDLFDFVEEIPVDDNSELGDVSDDDIGEDEFVNARNSKCSELFDMESIPIIFFQGSSLPEDGELENALWDSDDEVPLSVIRAREVSKKLYGLNLHQIAYRI